MRAIVCRAAEIGTSLSRAVAGCSRLGIVSSSSPGVQGRALRVAAPALTPAVAAEVGRRSGTAAELVLGLRVASARVFCFVEDVLGEPTAGVEDFDADDAAVFPVECDEPVDTVGCGGLRGGAVRGTGVVAEVDVGRVRVGVVADPHWVIVARRSATSCQYTTSDSRRFRQRIASFGVLPSSRLRS
jgi:hypothetical protein